MENESRLGRVWASISDKLQDQVWYQQGKAKFDELDANTRTAIKYGSLGIVTLGLLSLVIVSAVSVSGKKKELDDKLGLVTRIQAAQDELQKLKQVTAGSGIAASGEPWQSYFEMQASQSGIEASAMTVSGEKAVTAAAPAKKGEKAPEAQTKESIIDVTVKKVNLRQLVKFVFNIENGGRTAKVRRLQVDTQPDESGYLDITLAVSGFTLKAED